MHRSVIAGLPTSKLVRAVPPSAATASSRPSTAARQPTYEPAEGGCVLRTAYTLEARADDTATRDLLAAIHHHETETCLMAERAFLAELDGSCRTPIGGLAKLDGDRIRLDGLILRPDGSEAHETFREGPASDAAALGQDAGAELKRRGGPDFFRD